LERISGFLAEEHQKSALDWILKNSKHPDARMQPDFDIDDDDRIFAKKIRELHVFDNVFWSKWLNDSGLICLVQKYLKTPYLIKHAAFIKRRRDESYIPLHQDICLWEQKYESAMTFWIALSQSKRENGGMFYYPDNKNIFEHTLDIRYPMFKSISKETSPKLDWQNIQDIEAEPGDVLIWSARTAHGSYSNESGQLRIGMPLVFVEHSEYLTLNDKNERLVN
jgi:hypothetical protein